MELWLELLVDRGVLDTSEAYSILENEPPPETWKKTKRTVKRIDDIKSVDLVKDKNTTEEVRIFLKGGGRIKITSSEYLFVSEEENENR